MAWAIRKEGDRVGGRVRVPQLLAMKMEQIVPKRQHIKFRRRRITQRKAYNIRNMAKVWNQERSDAFAVVPSSAIP